MTFAQDEYHHKELPALKGEPRRQAQEEFRQVETALSGVSIRAGALEEWTSDHETAYNPHGKVTWVGDWVPGTYQEFDFAIDGSYSGLANKVTTDRLAPQNVGVPGPLYTGANPTDTLTAKQLTVGQRYTWTLNGTVSAIRLYTVTGNSYRVFAVKDPLGVAIPDELISQFTAENTGIQTIPIDPTIIYNGTTFDLYVAMEEPDPSPTTWTANYDYDTPQNPGTPGTGVIQQANSDSGNLHVHKTDSGSTDREAQLLALTAGDVVAALGMRWSLQAPPVDNGTYVSLAVAPATQGAPDGVIDFTFETVAATPITVVVDTDWWLGDANVAGRYRIDGGAWVETEDQYSIDMEVQEVVLSDDWDLLPLGGGGGGSGEVGPPGTTLHSELTDTATDGHPASVITGLDAAIDARIAAADNFKWPVGSVYFSYTGANPNVFLPGTWAQTSEGRFIVGAGSLDGETYTTGVTGGDTNKEITLTEIQMPSHTHGPGSASELVNFDGNGGSVTGADPNATVKNLFISAETAETGGSQAHENRPPWLILTVWRRSS